MKKGISVRKMLGAGLSGLIISGLLFSGCSVISGHEILKSSTPVSSPGASIPAVLAEPLSPIESNSSIAAVPSLDIVKAGDKFSVSVRVENDLPARGIQFSLSWDPAKIQCDSVEQGDYFKHFAQVKEGSLFEIPSDVPEADNIAGKFPANRQFYAAAIVGAKGTDGSFLGVTGGGNVFTLQMRALPGASGTADLTLANTKLVSNSDQAQLLTSATINGQITITP